MVYVFDTSSIIVLSHYFPDRFPTFWSHFEAAVADGTVVSVREVLKEIASPRPWLMDWVNDHKEMFQIPGPEETTFVAKIFEVPHFQMLVSETQRLRGQAVADPFVIACASVRGGTVVTEESSKPHSARIPNMSAEVSQDSGMRATQYIVTGERKSLTMCDMLHQRRNYDSPMRWRLNSARFGGRILNDNT